MYKEIDINIKILKFTQKIIGEEFSHIIHILACIRKICLTYQKRLSSKYRILQYFIYLMQKFFL